MRARNDVERADIAQLMVSSGEDITVNDSYGLEGVTTCSNLSSTSAVLVIRLHDLGGQHSLCPGIARSADRHPSVDLVTLAPRPEFRFRLVRWRRRYRVSQRPPSAKR